MKTSTKKSSKAAGKKSVTPMITPEAGTARPTLSLNVRAIRAALGSTGVGQHDLQRATAGDCLVHLLDPFGEGEDSAIYAGIVSITKDIEACRLAVGDEDRDVDCALFTCARRLQAIADLYSKITEKAEEIHEADLAMAMQGRVAS